MNSLFDFTFQNAAGFLIAFVPGLINLVLLLYILFFLPQNKLTNVFALLTFSIFFWQIGDALGRVAVSAEVADRWDCILGAAWIFTAPLCLHFSLLYSGFWKTKKGRLQFILLYLPAFFFVGSYAAHAYEHNFQYLDFWGWVNFHDDNATDIIQIYWISALVLCATLLLFYHTYRIREDPRLKYQSFFIAMGIAAPTLAGILIQVIFPTILGLTPIPVTSTFMTVFSFATVLALKKYKLFSVNELISNKTLIEALPLMVFSVSDEKNLTYMNPFGAKLLGIKKADAIRVKFDELFRYESPREKEKFDEVWLSVLQGEEVEILESSLITPKGKIDTLLSLKPIINNGQVHGVLFTARDITELKKSYRLSLHNEALLKKQNLELQKINSELDKFVYSVSHDLRAPLTSVMGLVEIAEEETKEPFTLEYLMLIEKSIHKLDRFILDILDYSRNSRMEVKSEDINCREWLDEIIQDLKFLNTGPRKVKINVEVTGPPSFRADKNRLSIVLNNLISNAIRYRDPGSDNPYVHIKASISDMEVNIAVSDNGTGIREAQQEKIFEMFYRASEKSVGSGLGLYIVKEAMKKIGGDIHLESEVGKGSVFRIHIPVN